MNDLIPYLPTHPGEALKEELEARNISQRKFAEMIGMPYTALNEIANGKRSVTAETALKIEAALDIEAIFWLNMQTRYNMQTARRDSGLSAVLQQILCLAAFFSGAQFASMAAREYPAGEKRRNHYESAADP